MQVAQTAHAAGNSVRHPLRDDTIVVALAVADEVALRAVAARLVEHGLAHHLVIENEGPFAGQAMAIGLEPVPAHDRPRIRKAVSDLPLVR